MNISKKLLYCFFLYLFSYITINAQVNINLDFTSSCSRNNTCNVFYSVNPCSGFTIKPSHGSPSFYIYGSFQDLQLRTTYDGVNQLTEGFLLNYNFRAGNTYKIEIKSTVPPIVGYYKANYDVYLTSSLPVRNDGCGPALSPATNSVSSASVSANVSQDNYSISYTPSGTYNQLWIRSLVGAVNSNYGVDFLSIKITETLSPISPNNVCCAQTFFTPGGDPTVILGSAPSGGNGIYTYQWYSSVDDLNYSIINGATGKDYDPPYLTSTRYYYRVVKSGNVTSTSSPVKITITTISPPIFTNGNYFGGCIWGHEECTPDKGCYFAYFTTGWLLKINPVVNADLYTWIIPAGVEISSPNGIILNNSDGTVSYSTTETTILVGVTFVDFQNVYNGVAKVRAEKAGCCVSTFTSATLNAGYCADRHAAPSNRYALKKHFVESEVDNEKTDILYPNPTESEININLESDIKNIEVFNMQGLKVKTFSSHNGKFNKLLISDLPSGNYLMRIYTKTNEVITKKIVKL